MKTTLISASILIVVAVGVASCGASAPGAGTAFCADVAAVTAGIRSSGSPSELAFLTTHEATVEDLGTRAPHSLRRDVQTFLARAQAAVAQNNPALINTPAVENASGRIKTYCGIPD